jgi:hypothetical protein
MMSTRRLQRQRRMGFFRWGRRLALIKGSSTGAHVVHLRDEDGVTVKFTGKQVR